MSGVMVEFTIEEAEGILVRLAPDPHPPLSATECDAAEQGRQRLERAVKVERGFGGNSQPVSEMDAAHRQDYGEKHVIEGAVRSLDAVLDKGKRAAGLQTEIEDLRDRLKERSDHIVAVWD
jgi:hypothetical protein